METAGQTAGVLRAFGTEAGLAWRSGAAQVPGEPLPEASEGWKRPFGHRGQALRTIPGAG
ncbi:hypothetical protein CU254_02750 [Amycolatopsis sp. AA4]|nr:hypothetical protein CU254_02750 [Amycolatopsis sp. AA4]